MMPLCYIVRNYSGGYKFTKSQEKMNDHMLMDDITIFNKNEKEI